MFGAQFKKRKELKMNQTTNTPETSTLRAEDLRNFGGTETWFRHSLYRKYLYTEGVQYVAETGGAYWLIDKIFDCQSCVPKLQNEEFCVWTLTLNKDGQGAKLTCTDGNETQLYAENILFTDFPLESVSLWLTNNTLLLPCLLYTSPSPRDRTRYRMPSSA